MTRRLARSYAAGVLILTFASGCDNVDWGGAELAVVPPPPKADAPDEEVSGGGELEKLPDSPLLYYVRRTEGGPVMVPVAEITGPTLRPIRAQENWEAFGRRFIAEHYREGTEYTLFRSGARVGTFVVADATIPPAQGCARLPQATGLLELTPDAEPAGEFLALSKRYAAGVRRRIGGTIEPTRTMQVLGPILAERMLRARQAQLPGNWYRAMAQLQPFPLENRRDAGFTATFLVGDELGPGAPGGGVAYSLFFVALPQPPSGFDTTYVDFTDYSAGGKSAPRVIDYLDWDRDDQVELLLEIYGRGSWWFGAVGEVDGEWTRILNERCERRLLPPAEGDTAAAGDTVVAALDARGRPVHTHSIVEYDLPAAGQLPGDAAMIERILSVAPPARRR